MNTNKTLELAALALCEHRGEDPEGRVTHTRLRGTKVVSSTRTYLEIATGEAKAALDAAVPGLLTGQVVVQPADMEQFG